jgi:hypothetical protein
VIVILIVLFYLSWLVSVIALVLIPLFILPARWSAAGCSG